MSWFYPSTPRTRLAWLFAALVTAAYAPAPAHAAAKPAKAKPKRVGAADKDAPVTILADQADGRADREVKLNGNVEINRADTTLQSERARYDVVEDTVEAYGKVRIDRAGDHYTGTELQLNLESGKGRVLQPTYKLELNNARGSASRVEFENEEQATVYNGTYSTCEAAEPDWYLRANTMNLDMGRNVGYSTGTTLYFKGVPIIPGIPALSFPLSNERKSGVLPPTLTTTSRGGLEFMLPYYFNIAPNRDLTLYPKLIAKRGIQLGAEARYLGEHYAGVTSVEVLPHDRETDTNRYAFSSRFSQALTRDWSYGWDLNTASDDAYPGDFGNSIITRNQRQLLRELRTDYVRPLWAISARVQNYQVLQDPDSVSNPALFVQRPYDRLPQISFYTGRYDVAGFDWTMPAELTRFWHPDLVRGTRLLANPQISYPFLRPGYYVTPKLSVHTSRYELEDADSGRPRSLSRTLPTFSVDSGMVFERDSTLLGKPVTQTLEPRLFYVYTPYRDQSQFPNFDSAEASFNFAQIFSENRFIGNDRISDANQLTAALVSRFVEPNGAARLRLALGQRFYFTPPRVELNAGAVLPTQSRSDLLLGAGGRINDTWSVDSLIQYSESERRVDSATHGVQWTPGPKRVLNAEYRYVRGSFEQLTLSAQWPIARRWYGVGRISRSLPDGKTVDSLLGVEYNADCWVLRMVGQRYATATQRQNSAIFFQLEFNGLSSIGPNPLKTLMRSISGYQKVNES
jgi:LPS-assembly protein